MPTLAVIGAQWGDEGKGKVVDLFAEKADMVVRFSGGDNAGHTVINNQGEFKLHVVPSGVFSKRCVPVIANGVVINPAVLIKELDDLGKRGVDTSRLVISDRAHVIMPYHLLLDGLEEDSRGGKALGTTRKGVGPAFTDKTARLGIRMIDLLDKKAFQERLRPILEYKNNILSKVYNAAPLSFDEVYKQYSGYGERLAPYVKETVALLDEALSRDKMVVFEGAQGTLLDPDFGTYPYNTSSSPLAGGACLGAGLGPNKIEHVLGVFKAYCTRVGGGPMPTELKDATGDKIRELAREYGTTTGRPRRCGWFDGVAGRFSQQVNGFTSMAITRLDILDTLHSLKVCTGYKLDGKVINRFPASTADLEKCQPVYEELEGWQAPITNVRRFAQLPAATKKYINKLEELVSCPASLICVGPHREQYIFKQPVLKYK